MRARARAYTLTQMHMHIYTSIYMHVDAHAQYIATTSTYLKYLLLRPVEKTESCWKSDNMPSVSNC